LKIKQTLAQNNKIKISTIKKNNKMNNNGQPNYSNLQFPTYPSQHHSAQKNPYYYQYYQPSQLYYEGQQNSTTSTYYQQQAPYSYSHQLQPAVNYLPNSNYETVPEDETEDETEDKK
jgi:hypothetical protein